MGCLQPGVKAVLTRSLPCWLAAQFGVAESEACRVDSLYHRQSILIGFKTSAGQSVSGGIVVLATLLRAVGSTGKIELLATLGSWYQDLGTYHLTRGAIVETFISKSPRHRRALLGAFSAVAILFLDLEASSGFKP